MHLVTFALIATVVLTLMAGIINLFVTSDYSLPRSISGWATACGLLVLGVLTFALIAGGFAHKQCRQRADGMNRDYRFGMVAGCRVETSEGFVPIDNLRITNEEDDT